MNTRVDIYDLMIYLIPGALFVALAYRFCVDINEQSNLLSFWSTKNPTLQVAFMIVITYVFGHIVQILGNLFEKGHLFHWLRRGVERRLERDLKPSTLLLIDSNLKRRYFTDSFWEDLAKEACEVFNESMDFRRFGLKDQAHQLIRNDEFEKRKNKYNEFFQLCYRYVLQQESQSKMDVFERQYSFYRSIAATGVLGIVSSALTGLIALINYAVHCQLNGITFQSTDVILLILCVVILFLFPSRMHRYDELFAVNVYRNFVLYSKKAAKGGS